MKTIFVKENDNPCAREITSSSCAQNARHEIKIPFSYTVKLLFSHERWLYWQATQKRYKKGLFCVC